MPKHSDEITEHVAKKIREARNLAGISQFELASRVGVDPDTVRNWESCRRRIDNESLLKLCNALNLDWHWMYGATRQEMGLDPDSVVAVDRDIWRVCATLYQAYAKINPQAPRLPLALTDCSTPRAQGLTNGAALDMVALAQFAQLALTA